MNNHPFKKNKITFPNEKAKIEYPFAKSNIVVLSSQSFNLEDAITKKTKLMIYSEYMTLTKEWVNKKQINAQIIPLSGETMGFLVNGLCDLCVCISHKEEAEKNSLKIIDEIYSSELGIFCKDNYKDKLNEMMFVNDN